VENSNFVQNAFLLFQTGPSVEKQKCYSTNSSGIKFAHDPQVIEKEILAGWRERELPAEIITHKLYKYFIWFPQRFESKIIFEKFLTDGMERQSLRPLACSNCPDPSIITQHFPRWEWDAVAVDAWMDDPIRWLFLSSHHPPKWNEVAPSRRNHPMQQQREEGGMIFDCEIIQLACTFQQTVKAPSEMFHFIVYYAINEPL
jgi:hypothetical protein